MFQTPARCFTLTGAQAGDALAKLCPVDFSALTTGDIRRTRAAQVAAAIWVSGEGRNDAGLLPLGCAIHVRPAVAGRRAGVGTKGFMLKAKGSGGSGSAVEPAR